MPRKDIHKDGKKFSKDYQPANRGMKPNPISAILKELGSAKEIKYHIEVISEDGQKKKESGSIKSVKDATINDIIAVKLIKQAITGKGDLKAIDMIMDRTEGKPTQPIKDVTEDEDLTKDEIINELKELGIDVKKLDT